jgi:hypothetical protein
MAQNVTKLTYQLKKAEAEIESLKRKEKAKRDEFLALQQGVTNKQKMLQQRINRLEQELLEIRKARDVLTREYQVTLQQVIDLGKAGADDKACSLTATVAQLSDNVEQLRKALEAAKALASDWEAKALLNQCQADLAGVFDCVHGRKQWFTEFFFFVFRKKAAERDQALRSAQETEAAAKQMRETVKDGGSGETKQLPLKGKGGFVFCFVWCCLA